MAALLRPESIAPDPIDLDPIDLEPAVPGVAAPGVAAPGVAVVPTVGGQRRAGTRAPHTQAPAGRCRHAAPARERRLRLVPDLDRTQFDLTQFDRTQSVLAPEPAAPPAPAPVVLTTRPRAGTRRGRAPLARSVYVRRRVGVVLVALTAVALAFQLASLVLPEADSSRSTGASVSEATWSDVPAGPVSADVAPADEVVVRSGDTLWSIAARIAPERDPRPVVDALAERVGGNTIVPGQRIAVDGLRAA